jgi:hypothetical protein
MEYQQTPEPPPPPPPPVQYAQGTGASTRTSGKAVASLVCGIIGIIVLPIVLSVLAIIFGAIARGETGRDPTLGGRGMATAGLVLGIIGVALIPVWIILVTG